jgi:hypothetical protein
MGLAKDADGMVQDAEDPLREHRSVLRRDDRIVAEDQIVR